MPSTMVATPKTMRGSEIRASFLRFFEPKGHTIVPSSSLVPQGDPTLLFTNAGMVQFKDIFLGNETRPYRRATTVQKVVRAGGKHNDLDEVGRTQRHHVFFEMLGNFSFGDYFKREAIAYAWELLTRDLALPKDRLTVTIFKGEDGVPRDAEAHRFWKQYRGEGRILGLGGKENFWAMGETGPCGPCSEIHFHQGEGIPCAVEAAGGRCEGPACDCDRWVEIWNLVFMQFEQVAPGDRRPLPKPSVDTGMGLERLCAVLQGVRSNYETDLLRNIVEFVARLSDRTYEA